MGQTCRAVFIVLISLFALAARGATVSYHGLLQEEQFGPLSDDFVIAGTFKPGFDVSRYAYVYGDEWGNLGGQHYTRAVADGNFRPIGAGTFANASGAFSGTGTTSGIDNLPIYLMLADGPNADQSYFLALVSGTTPPWHVLNNGTTTIDAATATIFQFGEKSGDRIMLTGIPIPEPSGAAIVVAGMLFLGGRRGTRRH